MSLSELRNDVIEFFNNSNNRKYDIRELKRVFCTSGEHKVEELIDVLNKLEVEGILFLDDRKKLYCIFPKDERFVHGHIRINKHGEGFIDGLNNGLKYKVDVNNLNGALNGDTVILKTTNVMQNGYVMCFVSKILERNTGCIVIEVKSRGNELYLESYDTEFNHPIIIKPSELKNYVEGDRLQVKIDKPNKDGSYNAEIIQYIGHKSELDSELKVIAITNKVKLGFSEEALEEAEEMPTEVLDQEKEGRLDLTDHMIFSIDGVKTKDRDDAVELEVLENGNYKLGVHIADVSYYVKPGSHLWDEAMEKGNSTYIADSVEPMLPRKLSNGICSLNPDVERLALSCIMEINPEGDVVSYDFVDTVIKSRMAMTYEDVNRILEDGEEIPEYNPYVDNLKLMQELARILEKKKAERGCVDFGSRDLEFDFDEDGKPIEIHKKEQKTAEKIIENFMLLAGECAYNYLIIPSPYRVHEKPEEEKVEEAFDLLQKSGIRICLPNDKNNKKGVRVKSMHELSSGIEIQRILDQIKEKDVREVAANIILRSMQRARFSVVNYEHFGLALKKYGQFTSPIRRAGDLVTHANVRMQRDNTFQFELLDDYYEEIDTLCDHITVTEQNSDSAEREGDKYEMVRYMEDHLGEKFTAVVTYVNSRGIYIKTPNGIEGKINPEDIEGDSFYYDDDTKSFKGKKTKSKIKIGTRLTAVAVETKKEFRTVNFGIDEEDLLVLTKKKVAL